jgi:type I restriction enzyme S subunit
MSYEGTTLPLEELCEAVIDCPHSTPVWMDHGVVVLRSSNIRNGRLDLSNPSFTDENHYNERSKRARIQAGDLVITREAPMGEVCLIPDNLRCCLGQRMVMLRPDGNKCHGKYLLYALQSRRVQNQIKSHEGTGSTVSNLRIPVLKELAIPSPSIETQKAIAHILGTLDDKIELNRKTNETLEAMAKALFNSWFVDFDPVRAKAEGRPTGLPAEISDLFPDSFEDSELGEIPCGWRVGSLDQIGINPRETAKPGEMNSSDRYIGLEHMPRESICLGESGQAEDLESNKNRFKQGDLLFGKLRPYFKKTGYAQFDGVCSTDIVVVRKKGEYGVGFICCFLASDPFIDFTVAASSGTRMPRSSWKDMCEFPFAIPSKILLREFDNQFCSTINKVTFNCILSASLAALRDALLPKLISGELRIPDAEKLLAEVGI